MLLVRDFIGDEILLPECGMLVGFINMINVVVDSLHEPKTQEEIDAEEAEREEQRKKREARREEAIARRQANKEQSKDKK